MRKGGRESLQRSQRFEAYYTPMWQRHTPFQHWILQFIGIDSVHQGKGYASTLLRPMLARIDEENLPCYLTTSDEEKVSLYQHYGFELIEKSVIPDTEVPVWAMLRKRSDELHEFKLE